MAGQTSGFGNEASAKDELIRNETPKFDLKNPRLIPDPPSTYVCEVCGYEVEKSSETLGSVHCGRPMMDIQKRKAIDDSVIRQILEGKG